MNIPATPTLPLTAQSHTSPAKAARDLNTRPDLAEQPFGKLVAALARGQAIPPESSSGAS
jgi:hypothetical protein